MKNLDLIRFLRLPWIPVEFYDSTDLVPRKSTADIWACGTCMWEIFSDGRKPCAGFNKTQIVQVRTTLSSSVRLHA